MARYIPDILLWLFVINHGIAFGAGLYEQRMMLPLWFNRSSESGIRVNSAAMRSTDSGRQFWAFVTTVPLTLLTLANLARRMAISDAKARLVAWCRRDYAR